MKSIKTALYNLRQITANEKSAAAKQIKEIKVGLS